MILLGTENVMNRKTDIEPIQLHKVLFRMKLLKQKSNLDENLKPTKFHHVILNSIYTTLVLTFHYKYNGILYLKKNLETTRKEEPTPTNFPTVPCW